VSDLTAIARTASDVADRHERERAALRSRPPVTMVVYEIPLARVDDRGRRAWVRMVLPADLQQVEADRLCAVLQTLVLPSPTAP
jgi:hypothetical protein